MWEKRLKEREEQHSDNLCPMPLQLRSIVDPEDIGERLKVYGVGVWNGKGCILASCPSYLEFNPRREVWLFSLPVDLWGWVEHVLLTVYTTKNAFPCIIEFGIINGRHYADFIS